jgi:hypothetical protein
MAFRDTERTIERVRTFRSKKENKKEAGENIWKTGKERRIRRRK